MMLDCNTEAKWEDETLKNENQSDLERMGK